VGTDAGTPVVLSPVLKALYGAVAVQSTEPPTLVSLEAMREEARWAGRFRSAAPDAAAWFTSPLSDILLVRAEAAGTGAIDTLTAVTLPGTVLPGGQPVGIYWEWYEHPPAGTVLAIEARVAKLGGKGRPDPLGRSACAPPGKAAIAVQWREPVTARPTAVGRAVALDLTRLEPGRYLIAISVSAEGATTPPAARRARSCWPVAERKRSRRAARKRHPFRSPPKQSSQSDDSFRWSTRRTPPRASVERGSGSTHRRGAACHPVGHGGVGEPVGSIAARLLDMADGSLRRLAARPPASCCASLASGPPKRPDCSQHSSWLRV
jgi:hypothetical protein